MVLSTMTNAVSPVAIYAEETEGGESSGGSAEETVSEEPAAEEPAAEPAAKEPAAQSEENTSAVVSDDAREQGSESTGNEKKNESASNETTSETEESAAAGSTEKKEEQSNKEEEKYVITEFVTGDIDLGSYTTENAPSYDVVINDLEGREIKAIVNGNQETIELSWDGSYDASKAGTYSLSSKIDEDWNKEHDYKYELAENVETPEASIVVKEAEKKSDDNKKEETKVEETKKDEKSEESSKDAATEVTSEKSDGGRFLIKNQKILP